MTKAVAFQGAGCRSAKGITSVTGPEGAPPRSRTSRCSAADTTARCTRKAIRSIDSLTARSASGDRTAGRYPRSRPRPLYLPIRSRPFARSTTHRGSACTRGRHARPGSGSAWMWSTRSTCCIPSPPDSWARPGERAARLRRDDRLPNRRKSLAAVASKRPPRASDALRECSLVPAVAIGRLRSTRRDRPIRDRVLS